MHDALLVGVDASGYSYAGFYAGSFSFSCSVVSRSQCQLKEKTAGVTVIGYTQGKKCEEVQCAPQPQVETRVCTFAGEVFKYGQNFSYGCQKCVCQTSGKVVCQCEKPRVRKEIRDLSTSEVKAFTDAVNALHSSGKWAYFTNVHLSNVPAAHGNPAFW